MTREEKAAKTLMLFNINDIGEGELNTWYSGIDKDMQEALNIAIEVLQGQSAYCEECREATNDMLRKMQGKIKELKDTKESDLINGQDAIDVVNYEVYDGYDAIVNGIKALPSAVPEYKTFCGVPIEEAVRIMQEYNAKPKTGEWIEVEKNEYEGFSIVNMRCNQCDKYAYLVLPKGTKCVYDYCPWCKADMRGKKNENQLV